MLNITRSSSKYRTVFALFIVLMIVVFLAITVSSTAPANFPAGSTVKIEENMTVSDVAELLVSNNITKSNLIFKIYNKIFFSDETIKQGTYKFSKPQSVLSILDRLTTGDKGLEKIKVTIPEGSTSAQIAVILGKSLPGFASSTFQALAKKKEGYLFPETYFFDQDTTAEEALDAMLEMYEDKISSVRPDIQSSSRPEEDVIIMSSIVEREAATEKDRRIIAGILWKRLDMGMPLQVDAAFYYVINKGSSALTRSDLTIDSPYNTYKNKGLPPTAISNPGLAAIRDTLNATTSPYFYYITGNDHKMYYAKTLSEHNVNISKHL